jgi:hypothetical protein
MSDRVTDRLPSVANNNGSERAGSENANNNDTALSVTRPRGVKSAAEMEERREEKKEQAIGRVEDKVYQARLRVLDKDYGLRKVVSGAWYRRLQNGLWIPQAKTEAEDHLAIVHDVSKVPDSDTHLSSTDYVMHSLAENWLVDFAQEIAGFVEPGEYPIGTKKGLVTAGGTLIPLIKGIEKDFSGLLEFFKGAFPEANQLDAWLGWLKQAVQVLRYGRAGFWKHGAALILIGEAGIGKTSLQHLITQSLAGRATDPKRSFKGTTDFNEQLSENEHWMFSDPASKGTKLERSSFLSSIKEGVANVWMGCHAKGKKEIALPTYRRMTVSLNPDPMALEIISGMEPTTLEKNLSLRFSGCGGVSS